MVFQRSVVVLMGLVLLTGVKHCQKPNPTAPTAPVGALAGSFAVSDSGAATYSVPIALPPGIGEAVPQLSIAYSSQAGDGLLGMGFVLQGFSSITRCPKNMAVDGVVGGIDYTDDDAFCLDGQRMIEISGGQYRLEEEQFARIQASGNQGTGPGSFLVTTRDGIQREYGGTSNSRIEAQGTGQNPPSARAYALNKLIDLSGNYYTITYEEDQDAGDYRPKEILYTGNVGASQDPKVRVDFVYEGRPAGDAAAVQRFIGPAFTRTPKRLTSIAVRAKNKNGSLPVIREYRLEYEGLLTERGRSRLESITECAGDKPGSVCKPATTFTWANGVPGVDSPNAPDHLMPAFTMNWQNHDTYLGDYNGDGVTDVYLVGSPLFFCPGPGIANGDTCTQTAPASTWRSRYKVYPGDFNGDGFTDIYLNAFSGNHGQWLCRGPGIASNANACQQVSTARWSASYDIHTGDFNGDGITDRWMVDDATQRFCSGEDVTCPVVGNEANWKSSFATLVDDFDGDGVTDLILAGDEADGVLFCSGSALATSTDDCVQLEDVTDEGQGDPTDNWKSDYELLSGDFNGDGIGDVYLVGDDALYACMGPAIAKANGCEEVTPDAPPAFPAPPPIRSIGMLKPLKKISSEPDVPATPGYWVQSGGCEPGDALCDPVFYGTTGSSTDVLGREIKQSQCPGGNPNAVIHRFRPKMTIDFEYVKPGNTAFVYVEGADIPGLPDGTILSGGRDGRDMGAIFATNWILSGQTCQAFVGSQFHYWVYMTNGGWDVRVQLAYRKFGLEADYSLPDDGPRNWRTSYEYYVGDFNGDGATDIGRVSNEDLAFCAGPYLGDSFDCMQIFEQDGLLTEQVRVLPGDFNGDASPDFLVAQNIGTTDQIAFAKGRAGAIDMIESIHVGIREDGAGADTVITYAPLTDASVYTKGSGALYPERDIQAPAFVVKDVQLPDGRGTVAEPGSYTLTYEYEGLRSDTERRQPLGFKKITVTDARTNSLTSVREFHQSGILAGKPIRSRTYNGQHLVSDTETTWTLRDSDSSCEACKHPVAEVVIARSFEENGAETVTKTTTLSNFDDYANPERITVVYDNEVVTEGDAEYWTLTDIQYEQPDLSLWILGLPSTVTVHGFGGPLGYVSGGTTSFDYDAGRLRETVSFVGDPTAERTTTIEQRDARGLPERVRQSVLDPNSADRVSNITYDAYGLINTVKNAAGQLTKLSYSGRHGQLLRLEDPNKVVTWYTYDGFDRLVKTVPGGGAQVDVSFDSCFGGCPFEEALISRTTEVAGSAPATEYLGALGRAVGASSMNAAAKTILQSTRYDSYGRVAAVSRPYFETETPHETTSEYDVFGRITKVVTPGEGDRTAITTYAPLTVSLELPDAGEGHHSTKRTFDSMGNVAIVTDANNKDTTYGYDAFGKLLTVTDSQSNTLAYTYDVAGRPKTMNDPSMGQWSVKHNGFGELIREESVGTERLIESTYDVLGRIATRQESVGEQSQGWTWQYDSTPTSQGLLDLVIKDDLSHGQSYTYDEHARLSTSLVRSTPPSGGAPEIVSTGVTYDSFGRLKERILPGLTAEYVYATDGTVEEIRADGATLWQAVRRDEQQRVVGASYGNGLNSSRRYHPVTDDLERIVTSDLPASFAGVTNGSFEEGNLPAGGSYRRLGTSSSDLEGWTVAHHSVDWVREPFWQASDGSMSIDMVGNGFGAISQTIETEPGESYAVSFDLAGNIDGNGGTVRKIRVSAGASTHDFDFEGAGRSYPDMGYERKTMAFTASGSTTELVFEGLPAPNSPFGAVLDNVSVGGSNVVQDVSYAFDARGNLRSRHDRANRDVEETFGYDGLNRLSWSEIDERDRLHNIYDDLGNVTCMRSTDGAECASDAVQLTYDGTGGPHAVTHVRHEPTSGRNVNGTSGAFEADFHYDADGRQELRWPLASGVPGRSVQYSAMGKPLSVLAGPAAPASATYAYDANQRLVWREGSDGGQPVNSFRPFPGYERWTTHTGVEHRVVVPTPDGTTLVYHTPDLGLAFRLSRVRYVHSDHLGSATVTTNSAGAVIEEQAFDAFGRHRNPNTGELGAASSVGSRTTDQAFTGQREEAGMNLYNYGARMYDPTIGRFIQPDPVIQAPYNPQNLNRYSYVVNNPLRYVDPTGNAFEEISRHTISNWGVSGAVDEIRGYGGTILTSPPIGGGNPLAILSSFDTGKFRDRRGPGNAHLEGGEYSRFVGVCSGYVCEVEHIVYKEVTAKSAPSKSRSPRSSGERSLTASGRQLDAYDFIYEQAVLAHQADQARSNLASWEQLENFTNLRTTIGVSASQTIAGGYVSSRLELTTGALDGQFFVSLDYSISVGLKDTFGWSKPSVSVGARWDAPDTDAVGSKIGPVDLRLADREVQGVRVDARPKFGTGLTGKTKVWNYNIFDSRTKRTGPHRPWLNNGRDWREP